jgi:glycosyltransferase-like protein
MPVRPRVALVTYSTKPRGGAVHTLHLAEALHAAGQPVHLIALGDPQEGFFRRVGVPHTIVPAPSPAATLEERVFNAIDALAAGLRETVRTSTFDLVHVQDCIAAGAALRVRDETGVFRVLRTVHHVDDFTTPALVACQNRSILQPDHALVVSHYWRDVLARDYGVNAAVVRNGVDAVRFRTVPDGVDAAALRARVGAQDRFLLLTVGGIEPRKGSVHLVEALAGLRRTTHDPPVLAVIGGHSFQDHRPYRDRVLSRAAELGLELDRDIVVVGTVDDAELVGWYHASDAFVFPSVKEGFGIVVLEAMVAGLPVVASDIPVFREFLRNGENALLARAGDPAALAGALTRVREEPLLRAALRRAGAATAARYTWQYCALAHMRVYADVSAGRPAGTRAPMRGAS